MGSKMKTLGAMLALASMGASMGYEDKKSFREDYFPTEPKKPTFSGVTWQGAIPKGCQLQKVELIGYKEDDEYTYQFSIIIEIVAGTNKAFNKKLVQKGREFQDYVLRNTIKDLIADWRLSYNLTPKPSEAVENV
jgi:hypothetical protein